MQFSSSCLDSFLSYCDGPPRDLHSFPTRRSSDLRGAKIQTIRSPGFDDFLIPIGSVNNSSPHDVAVWDENATRDRKSTRLNSSHLVISYAVFCLKKKKNKKKKTK